ncbi:564_t:CDS:2, partial [Acaulospora colombiana]
LYRIIQDVILSPSSLTSSCKSGNVTSSDTSSRTKSRRAASRLYVKEYFLNRIYALGSFKTYWNRLYDVALLLWIDAWIGIFSYKCKAQDSFTSPYLAIMTTPNNNERRIYSIFISGERFRLTRDQLESDPGNYFATFFFGDFAEAQNGCTELVIEKEPKLFRLIHAHLRGYTILPLSMSSIPQYMTHETALTNLIADAEFYGLQMLVDKLQ